MFKTNKEENRNGSFAPRLFVYLFIVVPCILPPRPERNEANNKFDFASWRFLSPKNIDSEVEEIKMAWSQKRVCFL